MTAVVSAENIAFSYRDLTVLNGVSFELSTGEFVALAGPNGSGKSTLIRILLGLLSPRAGSVRLFGSEPDALADRSKVGYVPQRPAVTEFLPATVTDIVAAGRLGRGSWWKGLTSVDRAAIDGALDAVGLNDLRHQRLSELSGGQQQRAFIAKALVGKPELLILDEPTAGIDADSQRRFRDAVVATRDLGGTVLLVSHELGAVAADLDRVLLVRHGVIGFDGTPAELTSQGVSLGVHASDLPVWLEGLE